MRNPQKMILAAAAVASLASIAFVAPAQAAQRASGPVTAKMTVACKLRDSKAATSAQLADAAATKELCQKYGIPGSGSYAPGFVPASTVYGNCGSSFLYIGDRKNGGTPVFHYGVNAVGPIVIGSATVWWQNLHTNATGNFGDTITANAGPDAWNEYNYDEYTGTGAVYTTMTGSVEIAGGIVCDLLVPTDTESIN